MDDFMIVSPTIELGLERLKTVLDILTGPGFIFNINKCSFLKTAVQYLGYEAEEIRPTCEKLLH